MKRLVKTVITLSVLLCLGMPAGARAGGAELRQFFNALDTSWEGHGTRRVLQGDGTYVENKTKVEIEWDRQSEDSNSASWMSRSQTSLDSGIVEYGNDYFRLQGDLLYVGNFGYVDPVLVTRSTSTSLAYRFNRPEWYTGRVYEFAIQLDLIAPRVLRGSVTVHLNGLLVTEDRFDLTRW